MGTCSPIPCTMITAVRTLAARDGSLWAVPPGASVSPATIISVAHLPAYVRAQSAISLRTTQELTDTAQVLSVSRALI
jgi:hypothetical protein